MYILSLTLHHTFLLLLLLLTFLPVLSLPHHFSLISSALSLHLPLLTLSIIFSSNTCFKLLLLLKSVGVEIIAHSHQHVGTFYLSISSTYSFCSKAGVWDCSFAGLTTLGTLLCSISIHSVAHTDGSIGMWEHTYQRGVGRKSAVTHFRGGSE